MSKLGGSPDWLLFAVPSLAWFRQGVPFKLGQNLLGGVCAYPVFAWFSAEKAKRPSIANVH
jgi:hypothetical protein